MPGRPGPPNTLSWCSLPRSASPGAYHHFSCRPAAMRPRTRFAAPYSFALVRAIRSLPGGYRYIRPVRKQSVNGRILAMVRPPRSVPPSIDIDLEGGGDGTHPQVEKEEDEGRQAHLRLSGSLHRSRSPRASQELPHPAGVEETKDIHHASRATYGAPRIEGDHPLSQALHREEVYRSLRADLTALAET